MIEMISFLFAIGVGFGLSCLIFGSMLDKSNNIGDSRGSANDYKAYIHYTARKDCLNKEDKTSFCNRYYERIDDPDLPSKKRPSSPVKMAFPEPPRTSSNSGKAGSPPTT